MDKQETIQAIKDGLLDYQQYMSGEEIDIVNNALNIVESPDSDVTIAAVKAAIKAVKPIYRDYDIQAFPGSIFNAKTGRAAIGFSLTMLLCGMLEDSPRLCLHPDNIRERCKSNKSTTRTMTGPGGFISWK